MTIAALLAVTLKVLPPPQVRLSLAAEGLDLARAAALMSMAMGSQADVAAAAHASGLTVLRLEGFGPSVQARSGWVAGGRYTQAVASDFRKN